MYHKNSTTSQESIDLISTCNAAKVTISKIEIQKKNKSRFSLFVNDTFLVGISDSALVHFNLKKGALLDQKLMDKIFDYEQRWVVKEYLIRLLGRRDHSRNELFQKGVKKGHSKEILDVILNELSEKGYINNRGFAAKFARDKFRFNHWGKQKIKIELKKKGVNEVDINIALQEVDAGEELEKIEYLVRKSAPKFLRKPPEKRRKNVFDFLIRKGYDSNVILKHLDHLLKQLEI